MSGSEAEDAPLLRPNMDGLKSGWRRACLIRWSLRMKRLLHSGHWKRFSPVWVRVWRASSSERANFFTQLGQTHGKGLSPGHEGNREQREISRQVCRESTQDGVSWLNRQTHGNRNATPFSLTRIGFTINNCIHKRKQKCTIFTDLWSMIG